MILRNLLLFLERREMTGKTHIIGGIALTGYVILRIKTTGMFCMSWADVGVAAGGSVIASLLPDIDEPQSTICHKLPFLSGIYNLFRIGKKVTAIDRNAARDASHRGSTHYLITWAVVSLLCLCGAWGLYDCGYMWGVFLAIGFVSGYLSHILLDVVSGKIPLFAPFSRKSVGVCLFRTGSLGELLMVRGLLFVAALYVVFKILK